MRLNRATDIGLRIVMYTASLEDQVTIDELAEALALPRHHLAKVVNRLQRLGVLDTTRGRGGGVRLAAGVTEHRVGRLVRDLEAENDTGTEVVDCNRPAACPLRDGCLLRGALRQAQEAFYASLDQVRIKDLLRSPQRANLLSLGPTGSG